MPAALPKPKFFKTYIAKTGEIKQKWLIVDAANQSLGRLSVPIAMRVAATGWVFSRLFSPP